MLSDNTEKSRNPLKKAMRRRNAKTVQFCAPTYFEASDVEYSSDEEDGEADPYLNEGESPEAQAQAQANGGQQDEDATAAEAVKLNRSPKDSGVDDIRQLHSPVENGAGEISTQAELSSSNDEISDPHGKRLRFEPQCLSNIATATVEDVMNGKSRRGTVRNTDSFFKDDSVETRKITLTPNILRDESSNSTIRSNESKEVSGTFWVSGALLDANRLRCSSRQELAWTHWKRPSPLQSGRRKTGRKRTRNPECLVGFSREKTRKVNLRMTRRTIRRRYQENSRDCHRNRKDRWRH